MSRASTSQGPTTLNKGRWVRLRKAFSPRCVTWLLEVVFEGILLFGIRPVVPFPRRIHNLQHTIGNALKSLSFDSLAFNVRHLPTFRRNGQATPTVFAQKRVFAFPRWEVSHTKDKEATDCGNRASETASAIAKS
ncbi:hypothetical protein AVEN_144506-1 [Araneus ventricosus]|uniref:Uncharacterized protein n=1 Tax=Araneus ventricosus TaxID=182803 RepID=A0A4Y2T4S9_ARAVE|nr:hypothetical protein AVEN_144506-1 [Araneus ventricosus]